MFTAFLIISLLIAICYIFSLRESLQTHITDNDLLRRTIDHDMAARKAQSEVHTTAADRHIAALQSSLDARESQIESLLAMSPEELLAAKIQAKEEDEEPQVDYKAGLNAIRDRFAPHVATCNDLGSLRRLEEQALSEANRLSSFEAGLAPLAFRSMFNGARTRIQAKNDSHHRRNGW